MKQRRKEGFCYIIIPRWWWWWWSLHPPQQQLDLTWGMTSEPRIYKKKKSGKQAANEPEPVLCARVHRKNTWSSAAPAASRPKEPFPSVVGSAARESSRGCFYIKFQWRRRRRLYEKRKSWSSKNANDKIYGDGWSFSLFRETPRRFVVTTHTSVLGYYLQNLITLHSKTTKWYYETHVLEERSREKLTSASWSSLLLALAWQWVIHIVRLV